MSELKLEVGKRYRDGPGNEVTITLRDDTVHTHKFVGSNGHYFAEDGTSNIADMVPEYSLVTEIAGEQPAPAEEFTPPEFTEAPAPLQIEFGKHYRRADGKIVKVDTFDDTDGVHPFAAHGQWYSSQGKSCIADSFPEYNLIEEVPAPVAEAVEQINFKADPRMPESADTHADRAVFDAQEEAADPDARGEHLFSMLDRVKDGLERALHEMREQEAHIDYLKMGRSVRFANYARGILFVLLGIAAMTFAGSVSARELLSIPNNAGGEIILTDTPSEHCDGSARIAISRAAGGKTISGCWVYSDAGYVYVKWVDDLRLYKLTDFRIIEQFDEPEKPATQTTPWRGAL